MATPSLSTSETLRTSTSTPLGSSAIYTPSTLSTALTTSSFTFPTYTSFPPFYTLQPNLTTRARQLDLWTQYITDYCAYHRIFRLSVSSAPPDLFANASIRRSLKPTDVRAVLEHMSTASGGSRIEWIPAATKGEPPSACYIYWRTAAEWGELLLDWVEETGQKGAVLTIYELREGEAAERKDWKGMDEAMLRKALGVLVKRGKAQIFGTGDGEGVKFF